MNAQKRSRIAAATTVTVVLLLVVLVAVMIYQIIEICVLEKRKEQLKEQIEQYEEQAGEYSDLIDYYTKGDGLYKLIIEYDLLN